jgi:hypothetical protein
VQHSFITPALLFRESRDRESAPHRSTHRIFAAIPKQSPPMLRTILALLAALAFTLPVAPAVAAPADVELLQSYAGSWRGTGELTGPDSGSVRCRLTFRPSGEKLSFSGRCTVAGTGTRSFSGVMSFNEATGRYEASSSDGTVVGRKSGRTITFNMSDTTTQGEVTSSMSLRGNEIRVDFELTDRNGEVSGSRVTFTRS